jgi:hypothetical protein
MTKDEGLIRLSSLPSLAQGIEQVKDGGSNLLKSGRLLLTSFP